MLLATHSPIQESLSTIFSLSLFVCMFVPKTTCVSETILVADEIGSVAQERAKKHETG